jgi:hypothetical protein
MSDENIYDEIEIEVCPALATPKTGKYWKKSH